MKQSPMNVALLCALVWNVSAQTGQPASGATKPAATAAKPAATGTQKPAAPAVKPATSQAAKPAAAARKRPPATQAVFVTSMGSITCKLFPNSAPKTVENFAGLADGTREWIHPATKEKMVKKPLYSGTVLHRVIPEFMIQGGDPLGNGTGGPGYKFEDEIDLALTFDRPGRLAMANAGKNTNGSQFFITEVPTPHLNGMHTIFGQCDEGQALVAKITRAGNGKTTLTKITISRTAQ